MKNIQKTRIILAAAILSLTALLYGCSSKEPSAQTRSDLTEEHIRGLYADMKRSDVEDLLGKSDSALAQKESFEMYSLADGTVAVLRYAGDKLQSALIRGRDNVEKALFSNYGSASEQINDGTEQENETSDTFSDTIKENETSDTFSDTVKESESAASETVN